MRVAAIYDIHGNLPALEAVLEEVRQEDVDHVVVGGDVVPGPMVRETLARLLALDVPPRFIQGNCEVAVLEAMAGRDQPAVPEQHRPPIIRSFSPSKIGRTRSSGVRRVKHSLSSRGVPWQNSTCPHPSMSRRRVFGQLAKSRPYST